MPGQFSGGSISEPKKILFVCLGNIVRSPLAENMFRDHAAKAGLANKYFADSAGTAAYHIGEAPDARMRDVAANHGLMYSGEGRQFTADDYQNFDLIIPMDMSNFDNLKRYASSKSDLEKIRMMRDFDIDAKSEREVPDPYYGGMDGFEMVYQMIERSSQELLRQLENGELSI